MLRTHFFVAVMHADGLRVSNPGAPGCCTPHPSTLVTVVRRTDDDGRLWFATSWRHWLAPSTRPADALAAVQALLNGEAEVIA